MEKIQNKYILFLGILLISLNVYSQSKKEITALFYRSISNNDLRVVSQLIEKGADPNIRDMIRTTPLMFASSYGYYEIADYLIKMVQM